jgi:hypothetical protein
LLPYGAMVNSLKKIDLRRAGRQALVDAGYLVKALSGPGFLPGARLEAVRGNEVLTVAVRATQERIVGFSRHPNGHWRTLETVDLVLVATPLKKSLRSIEVLAFSAAALTPLFDEALDESSAADTANSMPVFIPLDFGTKKQLGHSISGLETRALWRRTIELESGSDVPTGMDTFLERVKREFAELARVDAAKVYVEFRIQS